MWLGVATVASLPVAFAALVAAGGWWFSAEPWRGRLTEHFDGNRFRNPPGGKRRGNPTRDVIKFLTSERMRGEWRTVDTPPGPKPPARVGRGEMRVTFVNHATCLVQVDGLNFLTDPVWSDRVSPVGFAGPKRFAPPGIRLEDLPPIDWILLSHNHYDHLDEATLAHLLRERPARVATGLGNGVTLAGIGYRNVVECDWWESIEPAPGLRITFVPAQHFSGRGLFDRDKTLWGGFVVETAKGGSFYFAGDTGWGPHFSEIARRFPGIRLALLPIGAFRPEWFMSPVHIGPDEAVEAHDLLGARTSLVIHYGTFALGSDGMTEPVERLERALSARNPSRPDVRAVANGAAFDVPADARAAAGLALSRG